MRPSLFDHDTLFAERLGRMAALWIACTAFLGVALANVGMALLLLAVVLDARRLWQGLWREAVFRAWLLCLAASTLSLLLAVRRNGLAPHLGDYAAFLKLGLFLPIGWYLGRDLRHVWLALGGALAGFVLGRLLNWPLHLGLEQAMQTRFGFGLTSIAFGSYCAVGLLGLMVAAPRIRRSLSAGGVLAYLGAGAAALAALALWAGMLFSLSRAVWLVFALVAFAAAVLAVRTAGRAPAPGSWRARRYGVSIGAFGLLAGLLIVAWHGDLVAQRLFEGSDAYRQLLEGRLEAIGYSSVGLRLHAWHYAWECWLQHPWFGLGPGLGGARLLPMAPEAELHELSHFHSTPIEWLVRLGGIGASAAFGLLLVLARRLLEVWRSGAVPHDLAGIVAGALAVFLLVNLSNFRLLFSDGRLCWLILAGAAAALTFYPRRASTST